MRIVTFFLSWSGRDFRYHQFLMIHPVSQPSQPAENELQQLRCTIRPREPCIRARWSRIGPWGSSPCGKLANFANFWRARSRLYQNEILQENMRLTAFFKLYKICILLHRCNLKFLAKNRFEISASRARAVRTPWRRCWHYCSNCFPPLSVFDDVLPSGETPKQQTTRYRLCRD